jgi:hypothetical protein
VSETTELRAALFDLIANARAFEREDRDLAKAEDLLTAAIIKLEKQGIQLAALRAIGVDETYQIGAWMHETDRDVRVIFHKPQAKREATK